MTVNKANFGSQYEIHLIFFLYMLMFNNPFISISSIIIGAGGASVTLSTSFSIIYMIYFKNFIQQDFIPYASQLKQYRLMLAKYISMGGSAIMANFTFPK